MSEKKFEINSISEIKPDQVIVIDNGKFRVVMNRSKFDELMASKNIASEKRQQAWEAILNFRDKVNSVDKEKLHIGSTIPEMAIGSELFGVLGGIFFSDEEIKRLFSNLQK